MRLTIMRRTALLIALPALTMALVVWHALDQTQRHVRQLRSGQAVAALESSLSLVAGQHARARAGAIDEAEARAAAPSILRTLRYNDGVGYVAVTDDALRNILHPIDPALEDRDAADFLTADGRFIVREATALGRREGIGLLRYLFEHPETGEQAIKITAVGRYDPWGWTLYAGVFDEGVEGALAQITRHVAAVTVAAVAALLLLGLWYGRSLAQPLRALTRAMRAIAAGRHDSPVPHIAAGGEIGAAAQALADLRDDAAELATTRRRLETALETERRAARQQRDFIALVSHEFRTPMAIIDSAGRRLRRRGAAMPPGDIAAAADSIRGAVARLVDLMDRTLDTAGAATGKEGGDVALDRAPTDLAAMLQDVARARRALRPALRITVAAPDGPVVLHADARMIRGVLDALVARAAPAPDDAPTLTLRLRIDDGAAVVEVGEAAATPTALSRDGRQTPRVTSAQGLASADAGLRRSMTVATLHGGSLTARAGGAAFVLRLPLAPESAMAAAS